MEDVAHLVGVGGNESSEARDASWEEGGRGLVTHQKCGWGEVVSMPDVSIA